METKTEITKEEKILQHLDEGGALSTALADSGADHADTQLYSALSSMKDDNIVVPPRATFSALLSRISETPTPSPYVAQRSPFTIFRFAMPIALGLLIVVSGVGLETGRITLMENNIPQVRLQVEDSTPTASGADIATMVSAKTAVPTTLATSSSATSFDSSEVEEIAYDQYFEEESVAFTNIADAYDVVI